MSTKYLKCQCLFSYQQLLYLFGESEATEHWKCFIILRMYVIDQKMNLHNLFFSEFLFSFGKWQLPRLLLIIFTHSRMKSSIIGDIKLGTYVYQLIHNINSNPLNLKRTSSINIFCWICITCRRWLKHQTKFLAIGSVL